MRHGPQRRKKLSTAEWWRLPTITIHDLRLAFAGFGNVGGPAGFVDVNMQIGENALTILKDCAAIIRAGGGLDERRLSEEAKILHLKIMQKN